jgi:hypothetical protein
MTTPRLEPDHLSKQGAEELAARLDAYWRALGHTTVKHEVKPSVRANNRNGEAVHSVRSNLVRGMPPPEPPPEPPSTPWR